MKKLLVFILIVYMMMALNGCGSHYGGSCMSLTGEQESGKGTKLVICFRTNGIVPADEQIHKVENALNKMLIEKIDSEVELRIFPSSTYKQQMTLLLSGNEHVDIMGVVPQMTAGAVAGGQLLNLTNLLNVYGEGITEELSSELLSCGIFNGIQYTIPINADTATGMGYYIMRKDIVEKYNINADAIRTYAELTEVFQLIHDKEPGLTIVAPRNAGMSFLEYNCSWDKLGDFFGVLENYGQVGLNVVNLFETDAYKEYLAVMRDWYQRGFINADVTKATESGPTQIKSGTLFAYAHANKPGVLTQETILTGYEMIGCQVLESINGTANAWQWAIPSNSKKSEKAMEFLNLLYTDSDVINLLAYGVEGEDYVVREDGRIGYPTQNSSENTGYSMAGMLWSFGNEFNAHVWETNDADIWDQTKEWNKNGVTSKAFGFVFNSIPVSMEMAAAQNVYDQYRIALECGLVEPETALNELNEKLYSAGLRKIIDEKQRQLDKWAAVKMKDGI